MNDKSETVFRKILKYAKDTLLYVNGLDYDSFIADSKTLSAVAFALGQIGELAKNVSPETQAIYADIDWRGVRGLRNRLVHDYENIDLKMLWAVIRTDLPKLITQIETHLREVV